MKLTTFALCAAGLFCLMALPTSPGARPPDFFPPAVTPPVITPPDVVPREATLPTLPGLSPLSPISSLPGLSFPPGGAASAPAPVFSLECSLPHRFVEGMTAVVLFRFRRRERDVEETTISLVEGSRVVAGPVRRHGAVGPAGEEMSLNLRPDQSGEVSVQVRVESRFGESSEAEVRTASLILPVEPAARPDAAGSISINVSNDGGLVDLSSDALAGRFGLPPKDRVSTVSNPRVFRPVEGVALVSAPTRLTLEADGRRLHLLARSPVWFGRQNERPGKGRTRDTAAVLLPFASGGAEPDFAAARHISRTHFLVEPDGPRFRLRDGSPERDENGNIESCVPVRGSGCGTAVDGARLTALGFAPLPTGRNVRVTLAPDVREGGVLELDARSVPDASSPDRAAGALLRRRDGVRESYLALRCEAEADLGEAQDALRGRTVLWDGARFLLREPDGSERALVAGDSFGPPEARTRAIPFRQFGI